MPTSRDRAREETRLSKDAPPYSADDPESPAVEQPEEGQQDAAEEDRDAKLADGEGKDGGVGGGAGAALEAAAAIDPACIDMDVESAVANISQVCRGWCAVG